MIRHGRAHMIEMIQKPLQNDACGNFVRAALLVGKQNSTIAVKIGPYSNTARFFEDFPHML
jgi:hypothetical protein